jgi:c-di-GMP-binding flagellar brake protein YcgR
MLTQAYIDRRRHQRIEVAKAIFIEVVKGKCRRESDNTIIRCETVDVSVGGLRIYVNQFIAQGSKLNIAVPMAGWTENLEMVGKAMWVKAVENGEGYWVGLELRDSSRETMEKWFKVVHTLSSAPSV